MIWMALQDGHTSGPYRIYSEVRGYSVWIFSDAESRRLGREIPKLADAKNLCEQHAAGVAA